MGVIHRGGRVMDDALEPRCVPSWADDGDERLIAHIGPLDVYYEYNYNGNGREWLIVVGPPERRLDESTDHNFDIYDMQGNNIEPYGSKHDVHIELHEMCEIYALAVARGYIKESGES
jgi:hypothetical protein